MGDGHEAHVGGSDPERHLPLGHGRVDGDGAELFRVDPGLQARPVGAVAEQQDPHTGDAARVEPGAGIEEIVQPVDRSHGTGMNGDELIRPAESIAPFRTLRLRFGRTEHAEIARVRHDLHAGVRDSPPAITLAMSGESATTRSAAR